MVGEQVVVEPLFEHWWLQIERALVDRMPVTFEHGVELANPSFQAREIVPGHVVDGLEDPVRDAVMSNSMTRPGNQTSRESCRHQVIARNPGRLGQRLGVLGD